MQTANRSRHDVVVVGGRVAGSATAMLLARLGHDVVVVDQASFPSDTVSTHSIARSGVVQLRRWGLLDEVLDSGAPAIRQVTFNADGESVSRTIKDKAGVDLLVAPRRYVLDTILAAAAERAGAQVRTGVTVTGVQRDGRGRVVGVHGQTAPAPGRAPRPLRRRRRRPALAGRRAGRRRRSTRRARRAARPVRLLRRHAVDGFEFFVAERSFAGVFPTHDGQACIWVCTPAADAKAVRRRTGSRVEAFDALLERSHPELAERLRQRSPDLAGPGHAPPAQPAPPGVRPGLGPGRRRRLPP